MKQAELEHKFKHAWKKFVEELNREGLGFNDPNHFSPAEAPTVSFYATNGQFQASVAQFSVSAYGVPIKECHGEIHLSSCFCGHARDRHVLGEGECSECAPGMCTHFRVRGQVAA
jgi:hypothetical protein